MRTRPGLILLCLLAPAGARAALDGEGVHKSIQAVRTAKPPAIDGRLDDAVWAQAIPDDRFTQFTPDEGKPPTERTEVRVLYDDNNVYFGIRCFDSEPGKVTNRLTRRDRDIESDWLSIGIDSRHDHNSGRFFQLSPAGVQVDGEMYNDNSLSYDWDGVWRGATTIDDQGWAGEWAIPFSMLRFPDTRDQVWGIQFFRGISRKQEQDQWTYRPTRIQAEVSRYGHLVGISGIRPARTLELRPYVVGKVRGRAPDGALPLDGDVSSSGEVGLDAKVGLTRGLTLDATFNPDFGQVEADQVVLNLSNFETFFPEKRPFFIEGHEVFETPLTLFYPRRIGRPAVSMPIGASLVNRGGERLEITDVQGTVPIWGAAKVTGRIGRRFTLGVMGALTGAETVDAVDRLGAPRTFELAPERSYAVLRTRFDVARNFYLGAVATAVNRVAGDVYRAAANHDAYTQALDGWWQSQNGVWKLQAQAALSQRVGGASARLPDGRPCPEPAGDPSCQPITRPDGTRLEPGDLGVGSTARLEFSEEKFFFNATYKGLSPKFDPNDMGFVPEFNEHFFNLTTGIASRRPHGIFNKTFLYPLAEGQVSWDGKVMQHAAVGMDSEATFKNFWFTSPQLIFNLPRTYNDFETFDGAHFERPANLDANWVIQSNKSKALWGSLRGYFRKDLNDAGYFYGLDTSLAWQVRSNFELGLDTSVGYEQNTIRFHDCMTDSAAPCTVEGGARHYHFADLDSRFVSVVFRGTYTFIPALSVQTYAQLFTAKGTYDRFRDVDTMGSAPFIRLDDLRPSTFTADDGFETTSLNLNVVMRWEPMPGSTLFAVYTRAQEVPRYGVKSLSSGANEDVFLLKFVYFAS